MTATIPDDALVIEPHPRHLSWKVRIGSTAGWVALIGLNAWGRHFGNLGVFGLILVFSLFLRVRARRERLFVTPVLMGSTRGVGKYREWPAASISRLVLVATYAYPRWARQRFRWLVILDHQGWRLGSLRGDTYQAPDLWRVARALHVPLDGSWDDAISGAEFLRRFPRCPRAPDPGHAR